MATYNLRSRSLEETPDAPSEDSEIRVFYVTRRISRLNSKCALSGIYINEEYQTLVMKKCYHTDLILDWFRFCKSFVLPDGQDLDEESQVDMSVFLEGTEAFEKKEVNEETREQFLRETRDNLMNKILCMPDFSARSFDYFKCIVAWSYARDAKDCIEYLLASILACDLIDTFYSSSSSAQLPITSKNLKSLCKTMLENIFKCSTNEEIYAKLNDWKQLLYAPIDTDNAHDNTRINRWYVYTPTGFLTELHDGLHTEQYQDIVGVNATVVNNDSVLANWDGRF